MLLHGLPLQSNFCESTREKFSVDAAKRHLQSLPAVGKAKAAEYILRAPGFVDTPLRQQLETERWFSGYRTESE